MATTTTTTTRSAASRSDVASPAPSTPERDIPARRISFDEQLAELPKHFAADEDLITSHLIAVLSGLFPDGEDFFVRSVRHYRDRIDDPVLKKQVAGFIGQEAIHGREHRALNERLDELGYRIGAVERQTRFLLKARERLASAKWNLGTTAALEHYTATLAAMLLSEPDARRRLGDGAAHDVLVWHALEEAEHKAVAFDVYRYVGGTERMRRWSMNLVTVGFFMAVGLNMAFRIAADRETYRWGRLWKSFQNVRHSPLFRRQLWRNLRDYNRPGFHPDDHDTDDLLDEWRERLFGADGEFNDRLAGSGLTTAA